MTAAQFSLDGKVAVVTGGYGTIGGALATGLAAAGAHVAVVGRKRGDRGIDLTGLDRRCRVDRVRVGDDVVLVRQRSGPETAALRALLIQERVPERPEEIAEVVLAAEEARLRQHPRVRLLHEILGVLPLAGQPKRPQVELITVGRDLALEPGGGIVADRACLCHSRPH